jgi:hypothetical protein
VNQARYSRATLTYIPDISFPGGSLLFLCEEESMQRLF